MSPFGHRPPVASAIVCGRNATAVCWGDHGGGRERLGMTGRGAVFGGAADGGNSLFGRREGMTLARIVVVGRRPA